MSLAEASRAKLEQVCRKLELGPSSHVLEIGTGWGGFDSVDCGELRAARHLEPFAMTWIHLAIKLGRGRSFAFARLRR